MGLSHILMVQRALARAAGKQMGCMPCSEDCLFGLPVQSAEILLCLEVANATAVRKYLLTLVACKIKYWC